ncbi:hypothetical protein PspLS_10168 [Pyricularia sp. CBS 133598]|nr:hypothetical protein PspLS_10168 [Pyricularia sp. CBS 133598]
MPLLHDLELGNVIISDKLVRFLKVWSEGIDRRPISLTLANATADRGFFWGTEDCITWATLFGRLLAQGIVFSSFDVTMKDVELTDYDGDNDEKPETLTADCIAAREKQAANPHLQVFAYGEVDDKYHNWWVDEKTTIEQFLLGDDQLSYESLKDDMFRPRWSYTPMMMH